MYGVYHIQQLIGELRGEAYNLTNTVVFSNPNTTCCWVTNASTGAIN
jgi:hypothetical protein